MKKQFTLSAENGFTLRALRLFVEETEAWDDVAIIYVDDTVGDQPTSLTVSLDGGAE